MQTLQKIYLQIHVEAFYLPTPSTPAIHCSIYKFANCLKFEQKRNYNGGEDDDIVNGDDDNGAKH